MAVTGGGQPATVTNPTVLIQFGNASSPTPVSVGAMLDAAFGASQNQTLIRGATSWSASQAVGPFALNFSVSGGLTVANDVAPWRVMPSAFTAKNVFGMIKTPATTADVIFDLLTSSDSGGTFQSLTGGTGWTITATANFHVVTLSPVIAIPANYIVRLDILQVGSGTAGSDLTVTLSGDANQ